MVELLERFVIAGKAVRKANGIIFFEWPGRCTYWKRKDVIDMTTTLQLQPTNFNGCALGLKSANKGREHLFIKKPWKVFHNCPHFDGLFSKFTCPGVSRIHQHDQCRGINAKKSKRYTETFALNVHRSICLEFESR
jgi:hypothetical protein